MESKFIDHECFDYQKYLRYLNLATTDGIMIALVNYGVYMLDKERLSLAFKAVSLGLQEGVNCGVDVEGKNGFYVYLDKDSVRYKVWMDKDLSGYVLTAEQRKEGEPDDK